MKENVSELVFEITLPEDVLVCRIVLDFIISSCVYSGCRAHYTVSAMGEMQLHFPYSQVSRLTLKISPLESK
jgi:hypothetical protein